MLALLKPSSKANELTEETPRPPVPTKGRIDFGALRKRAMAKFPKTIAHLAK